METVLNWDERLMGLAKYVATWSKDPSTQVGAVIADDLNRVVAMGYNGFPRGIDDSDERLADRPTKYAYMVHGEVNAILNSTRDVRGCVMYVTLFPCVECTKLIIQSGIKEVVSLPASEELWRRWGESWRTAKAMLGEAGIVVRELS